MNPNLKEEPMEKYSKQREEIIEVLKEAYDHPTAEQIYERVREKKSTSSRGTVYRNLKNLVEKNKIIKISIPDAPDRYDYIRQDHSHIICLECKKVIDFEYNFKNETLKKLIKSQTEINPDMKTLTISGICKNCQMANKNKGGK